MGYFIFLALYSYVAMLKKKDTTPFHLEYLLIITVFAYLIAEIYQVTFIPTACITIEVQHSDIYFSHQKLTTVPLCVRMNKFETNYLANIGRFSGHFPTPSSKILPIETFCQQSVREAKLLSWFYQE